MKEKDVMKEKSHPKFYQRDNRWLVSFDTKEVFLRGDLVEVMKRNGDTRVVEIQDELVNASAKPTKRFYLNKDVTALYEQGYLGSIGRYRNLDGTWWGWKVDSGVDDE